MTIADLKALLDNYRDDAEVMAVGTDSGGYDAMESPFIRLVQHPKRDCLLLEGFEP